MYKTPIDNTFENSLFKTKTWNCSPCFFIILSLQSEFSDWLVTHEERTFENAHNFLTLFKRFNYVVWAKQDAKFKDEIYTQQEMLDLLKRGEIAISYKKVAEWQTLAFETEKQRETFDCEQAIEVKDLSKVRKSYLPNEFLDWKMPFEVIARMDDERRLQFCQQNKQLMKVLREKFLEHNVKADFKDFPIWFKASAEKLISTTVQSLQDDYEKQQLQEVRNPNIALGQPDEEMERSQKFNK